jgi:hypothetical protein
VVEKSLIWTQGTVLLLDLNAATHLIRKYI